MKACMLTTVHPAFDNRIFHKEAKSLAKIHDVVMIAPNEKVIVLEEMKRCSRDKVIIIHETKCPLQFFKQKDTLYDSHYFVGKELKRLLEAIDLDNVKIMYVTHSTPSLFNILGEMKAKKLERIIQNMPFIKRMGGGHNCMWLKSDGQNVDERVE